MDTPLTINSVNDETKLYMGIMKITLTIIALVLVLLIGFGAMMIYRTSSYEATVCEHIREISLDTNLLEYLSSWVLNTYGEPRTANDVPEQLVSAGLDWSRLNIDPKFSSFAVRLTKITEHNTNTEEEVYFVSIREGRAEVIFLVPALPRSKNMALDHAIPPAYEEVSPGVWYFCD